MNYKLALIFLVTIYSSSLGDAHHVASASETVAETPVRDLYSDTWVGVDGLGRPMPIGGVDCPTPRDDRTVAIFYFLWLGQHSKTGPWDISKITAENPDDPQFGPRGIFHHWGQPELGYYMLPDEYVFRQHARMLTDAGVDAISCDVTNAFTYANVYGPLCETYEKMRSESADTPEIAFLTNTHYEKVVAQLYRDFYAKHLHETLWFRWNGLPLLMASHEGHDEAVSQFFTFRRSWAWSHGDWFGDGKDRWPWLEDYPQKWGWHESPDRPEQVSVSVAQHPISNIGQSYHDGKEPDPKKRQPGQGLYFQEQWDRAIEVDPRLIFVTGWNEWVAQRFIVEPGGHNSMLGKTLPVGGTYFVDAYNDEFNRDIEPMRDGHTDHLYYQLVSNIRHYKGARPTPTPSGPKTMVLDSLLDDWADVLPEFRDSAHDTMHRNSPGWGDAGPYIDRSGRNDIITAKVARDDDNIYFMAETRDPIDFGPDTPGVAMRLLINADADYTTGPDGYDFVVNMPVIDRETTTVCPLDNDGKPGTPIEVPIAIASHGIELSIPRSVLGIDTAPMTLDLHWVDSAPMPDESNDSQPAWGIPLYTHGDNAPNRRLNYRYQVR